MGQLLFGPAGTLRNGWKAILFILVAYSCNGVLTTLRQGLPGLADHPGLLPLPWFSFLAILGATGFCLAAEDRPLASVGLRLDRRWAWQVLAGFAGGAGLIGLMTLAGYLAGGFHLARNPAASPMLLLAGAWLFLGVALGEELLFRGYLFQRLERGLGAWPAQALLALLFALLHWGNPGMTGATRVWASGNIAIAGVLLGLCYLRTRSLALPVGVHLGWNWTQGALLGFGVSGNPSAGWWHPVWHRKAAWIAGGAFGLEASLVCTLICIAACLVLTFGLPVIRPEE
jgi:membrane protease YdiL (CAAX protease family)